MRQCYTIRLFWTALSLITGLSACEDCGPADEPTLQVSLLSNQAFRIDTLYGIGAVGKLADHYFRYGDTTRSLMASLPLNLQADSVSYTLVINGRPERLTVFYRRDYSYRSRKCGYVLDILPPEGKRAQALMTTGTVNSIYYHQNSYQISFPGTPLQTGILLSLRL